MHFKKQKNIPENDCPNKFQYCTLNCERRQISKCLDVMKKKIPHRSLNNLQIKPPFTNLNE